jgi:hemerythrin-like domain-containing protein
VTSDRLVAWGDELRKVHERLRNALDIARESLETDEPQQSPRDLLLYCWGFCTALKGHHRSEDASMFPMIVAVRPDLAPVIDNLVRDHSMLDHLIGGLEVALSSGASKEESLRHLDGIEAVMETHFGYEERQLIAVLNALTDDTPDKNELFGPIA